MNLQDELKVLKKRIAELEQQAKQEQKFPQFREDYWFVDEDVELMKTLWHGDFYDHKRLSIDNVFETKKQAQFALEKLKVEAELRNFSRPFKDKDNNYYIELYLFDKTLSIDNSDCYQTQGTIYFESTTIANEATDTVGADRIKKYIFGVED